MTIWSEALVAAAAMFPVVVSYQSYPPLLQTLVGRAVVAAVLGFGATRNAYSVAVVLVVVYMLTAHVDSMFLDEMTQRSENEGDEEGDEAGNEEGVDTPSVALLE